MQRSFSGANSGKGAVYAWDGNKNVGSGRMEILDVSVPSKIVIKLDFLKPFEAHNTAEFTMLPQGDATSDAPPAHFHKPQGFSVSLSVADPAEAERKFTALCEGGSVHMPFGKTFFSKGFGMGADQFGIPWMVNCPLEGQ